MKHSTKILGLAVLCTLAGGLPAKADTYFRDSDTSVLNGYVTTTRTTRTTTTTTTGDNTVPVPTSTTTVTYYKPGTILPESVTYTELPATVTEKLVAAPSGDEYVVIGGNAYLINHEKRIVIDAKRLNEDPN